MDNALAKYINQELKGIIQSVQVIQGTARETGNPYYAIEMTFINGYTKRLFVNSGEQFAWINAMELLNTEKVVDNSI